MERLLIWPANPAASILALWLLSQVFLYFARVPMHKGLDEVGRLLGGALRICARWCRGMATRVTQRDREMILEMGKGDLEAKVGREFHRIEGAFAKELARYPDLHRKIAKAVTGALESTKRIDGYMASYEKIRKGDEKEVRALGWSSTQLFVVSVLVLAVAIGGAFVNFNLIALPMSELVPSGSRIGGMPVSTVAALVIVLMEIAAGIFAMEMLGITSFFPKLDLLPSSRRRIILVVALAGLLLLACIESSLAVLREQIVESATAL